MGATLDRLRGEAFALHGHRAYPNGWPSLEAAAQEERATEGAVAPGWSAVLVPNYSNALFALTPPAQARLRAWVGRLQEAGLHRLPADDLLSAACAAHPGIHKDPMRGGWLAMPPAGVAALAPTRPLSRRLRSSSDTERRTPLGEGRRCALLEPA